APVTRAVLPSSLSSIGGGLYAVASNATRPRVTVRPKPSCSPGSKPVGPAPLAAAPFGATATTQVLTTKLLPAATSGFRLSASSVCGLASFRFGLTGVSARTLVEVKGNNLRISRNFRGIPDILGPLPVLCGSVGP